MDVVAGPGFIAMLFWLLFELLFSHTVCHIDDHVGGSNDIDNHVIGSVNKRDVDREVSRRDYDEPSTRNATAQLGHTAFLHCLQPMSSGNPAEVSWLRRHDWHLLTTGKTVFTSDERFRIFHDQQSGDWVLKIGFIQNSDRGLYECQISTGSGKLSQLVNLGVVRPVATIEGAAIYHVQRGSSISLKCVIKQALKPPSYVDWYHNLKKLNLYKLRSDIKVWLGMIGLETVSTLNISDARQTDAGNYTCSSDNSRPASVNVFVSQGDNMAAIQRRKGTSGAGWWYSSGFNRLLVLPFILGVLR